MDREMLFAVVLGILLVVGIFQAVQLVGLSEKVKGLTLASAQTVAGPASSTSSASAGGSLGKLQNLPSQVGGC